MDPSHPAKNSRDQLLWDLTDQLFWAVIKILHLVGRGSEDVQSITLFHSSIKTIYAGSDGRLLIVQQGDLRISPVWSTAEDIAHQDQGTCVRSLEIKFRHTAPDERSRTLARLSPRNERLSNHVYSLQNIGVGRWTEAFGTPEVFIKYRDKIAADYVL